MSEKKKKDAVLETAVEEYVAKIDPNLTEGYNPEVGDEYDDAQEAIRGSYSDQELLEQFGVELDQEESGPLKAIIGADNRDLETSTRYPFSAICKLFMTSKNNKRYVGTGFLISPRIVVTAGHCVYFHNDGGWAKSIEVVPRLIGNQKPFGSAVSGRYCTYCAWINNKDSRYDIGVIILPENNQLGKKTGWWGFGTRSLSYYKGAPITTAGYPGDKPAGEMWRMSGNDTSLISNDLRIKYAIDTYGGQSGSPVWEVINRVYYVLGVHTNGHYDSAGKGIFNSATRIDKTKYDWLVSKKNADLNNKL